MTNNEVIIWGVGRYLEYAVDRIDPKLNIIALCDSDSLKWGRRFTNRNILCISPDEALDHENIHVYICTIRDDVTEEIVSILKNRQLSYSHINEAIREYQPIWESIEISKYDKTFGDEPDPEGMDELRFFASIAVPIERCNLRCDYCYIGQHGQMKPRDTIYHSPEFLRRALSRKRLGGTAMINLCGAGETLLCDELIPIIIELLKEGHYVSVITNALIGKRITELIGLEKELSSRLFFKCSLHYTQLRKRNLLDQFAENVNRIIQSEASVSIEIVPDDNTMQYIDEIKEYSIREFGALPQLTVARNEGKEGIPLLTSLSAEDYYKTWKSFDSQMFEFKLNNKKKISDYCLAGECSALFALDDGNVLPCPYNIGIGNIYSDISKRWTGRAVGNDCCSPWCINAHAYLALGLVDTIRDGSYLEIRDRVTSSGDNWIKPRMARFFGQRICDNLKNKL